MREGDRKAKVSLPQDKSVYYVSYQHMSNVISYPIASAASRGINVNRMAGMKILEAGHRKDGHMSRIIGDRTRNTLDEMEEVSRQFNEECNEEERRKADKNKVKNKEEAGRAKAPSSQ